MSVAFGLKIVVIVAAVIIVAATVIYRIIYKKRINRQLNDEAYRPRKILSPWTFSLITVFAVLLAFAGLTTFLALHGGNEERVPEEYINAIYDYQTYEPEQMTGYRSVYSIDENPGYTKQIEQKGDVRFTCFIRDDNFDYYHPAFIIYVEYTGNKNILYYGMQGNYFTPNDILMTGFGHAGSEFEEYFCVIGTSTMQSRFELTAYLYDSARKGEEMSDFAAANETIVIQVPMP